MSLTPALITLILSGNGFQEVTNFATEALKSKDWERRYMGLYFISRLIDANESLDSAKEIVLKALNDPEVKVQAQALWVLHKLVQKKYCLQEAQHEAIQKIQSDDWRLRISALDLFSALADCDIALVEAKNAVTLCSSDSDIQVQTSLIFLANKLVSKGITNF